MNPIPPPPNPLEGGEPRAARQPDGKTLVLWLDSVAGDVAADICFARLLADGTADNAFGNGGFVRVRGVAARGDLAVEVLVRDDGRFLGLFNRPVKSGHHVIWIAWFTARAELDLSRGNGGISELEGIGLSFAESAALLPDGRIVVAGAPDSAQMPGLPAGVSRMARLDPDGGLDTTFGERGSGIVALTAFGKTVRPAQVVVAQDGTIFVTGKPPFGQVHGPRNGAAVAVMKFEPENGRRPPSPSHSKKVRGP